jgi:hypothetical protein
MRVPLRLPIDNRNTKEFRSRGGTRVQSRKRQWFYFFAREFQMNMPPGPRILQRTRNIFPAHKAAYHRIDYSPNRNLLTASPK